MEEFVLCKDYQRYSISNFGNIKNNKTNKIFPRPIQKDYYEIRCLRNNDGKPCAVYIHKLVAEAFLPNPCNKKYVTHKNKKKNDNHVSNLLWTDKQTDGRLKNNILNSDNDKYYVLFD